MPLNNKYIYQKNLKTFDFSTTYILILDPKYPYILSLKQKKGSCPTSTKDSIHLQNILAHVFGHLILKRQNY